MLRRYLHYSLLFLLMTGGWGHIALCDNQTPTVSRVSSSGERLPFQVKLELADFSLPQGIQAFVSAKFSGKFILLAGSANGLNGLNSSEASFSSGEQNTTIYVVDPTEKTVYSKSLNDATSGLSQRQIDLLSVTNAQFYQHDGMLYIAGGYGIDTATGESSIKDSLTAIDLRGLVHWVLKPYPTETLAHHIRQIHDPVFQVMGGYMTRTRKGDTWLMFGQTTYTSDNNGQYSEQVRRFKVHDDGKKLSVKVHHALPKKPNPHFARQDLNVVPIVHHVLGAPVQGYGAFGGVFTPTGGAWTVPVIINTKGKPKMENPDDLETFKQAMNQYACPTLPLYSNHTDEMYILFFGGKSYGFFENGKFQTDPQLPFINQISAIRLNKKKEFKQYILKQQYPVLLSTESNAGNPLLFGARGQFIPVDNLPTYGNGVIKLDQLSRRSTVIGYVIGGIQSTLAHPSTSSDYAASPYIFKVILKRIDRD
ncbi:hypothetical protein [Parachlamydia sp. AcF125]|uniref:hypothetical protein n=1 Tax=Parachlamydia sp. AcF125 TaxID=2795736 RepID=UPI001BD867BB|nr:hypothetical protein [Parachlamydia sp. AcF125]MBS4169265.1 hypothetical protein [Parachlamydia sp. AcF125]